MCVRPQPVGGRGPQPRYVFSVPSVFQVARRRPLEVTQLFDVGGWLADRALSSVYVYRTGTLRTAGEKKKRALTCLTAILSMKYQFQTFV